jgi:hypothetical protein
MASPEAHLEVALEHQARYEELGGVLRGRPATAGAMNERARARRERLDEAIAVENHALLAIAGFLSQMHICDHGTRGWCPPCHLLLLQGSGADSITG